ncbi:hypothetical protein T01_14718 [Trichinella spiralis]|uniref:Uncharacterized protein n=1 Tax=Trichinella spiralis TaxID=6334 RepID=A0A0V1B9Z9_TRISP|nr:hypothetical protein T01_14718 [Trichinella spiralis]
MTSRRRSTATTKLSRRARKRDAQDERINLEINGEDDDHCTSAKQSCQLSGVGKCAIITVERVLQEWEVEVNEIASISFSFPAFFNLFLKNLN